MFDWVLNMALNCVIYFIKEIRNRFFDTSFSASRYQRSFCDVWQFFKREFIGQILGSILNTIKQPVSIWICLHCILLEIST